MHLHNSYPGCSNRAGKDKSVRHMIINRLLDPTWSLDFNFIGLVPSNIQSVPVSYGRWCEFETLERTRAIKIQIRGPRRLHQSLKHLRSHSVVRGFLVRPFDNTNRLLCYRKNGPEIHVRHYVTVHDRGTYGADVVL